jgi:hypothetical protein
MKGEIIGVAGSGASSPPGKNEQAVAKSDKESIMLIVTCFFLIKNTPSYWRPCIELP